MVTVSQGGSEPVCVSLCGNDGLRACLIQERWAMDLTWNEQELAFRQEVRDFVEAELPADIREKVLKHQRLADTDFIRWHRILAEKGWGAPSWPVEFGGTGWGPLQRLIFEIECFKA